MLILLKITNAVVFAFLMAVLGFVLSVLTIYYGAPAGETLVKSTCFIFGFIGVFVALISPTLGRAWRRMFFISSAISFLIILSTLSPVNNVDIEDQILTYSTPSDVTLASVEGYEIIGLFLVLGIVFCLLGIVMGKNKKRLD